MSPFTYVNVHHLQGSYHQHRPSATIYPGGFEYESVPGEATDRALCKSKRFRSRRQVLGADIAVKRDA
ncbi:hypothetical protein AWB81_07837 [Caballeronia arationis]|nr:hypothetical protein AWB81_07837 [Caballeronia arationis]